jgi:hypothetical protein
MGKNILKNKLAWLYIFFLIFNEFAFSQKTNQISGTIIFDNKPLKGAIIQLYNYESDSLINFTFSGSNGYFNLKRKYFMTAYTLKISHVSVNDTLINIHSFLPDSLDWNEIIVLNRRSKILQEIIIKAPSLPFKINGDTINYLADKYQANDVNKLEDLLKKMEGFHLDDDGKISFNGKQINKILIEGDDLTGTKYKVLSKNIQSNLVSSVQVIQNFNDNPLLKGMDYESTVGLNIKIKPDKKNKINGHADFQSGNAAKFNLGLDLVSLNNQFNSLFFVDKNNIGNDVSEDILYHWNGDNENVKNQNKNQLLYSPIKQFVFPRPGLKPMYFDKNNDHSIIVIESIKVSKHARFKMLGTYIKENKSYAANFYRNFYFQGTSFWEMNYKDFSSCKGNYFGNKMLIKIDNTKNRIAEYAVSLSSQKNKSSFYEYRSGFEVDTLIENLHQVHSEFMFDVKETLKLGVHSILKIENTTAIPVTTSNLFFQSERLPSYLQSVKSQDYNQYLGQQIFSSKTDLSLNNPSVKMSKIYGLHADVEHIFSSSIFTNYVNEVGVPLLNNGLKVNSTKIYAYGHFIYRINKKININTQVGLGIGNINVIGNNKYNSEIYAFNFSTNYLKTAFKQVGLSFHLSKKPPFSTDFFPSPLVSGHSTLLYGIQQASFPISRRLEMNFLRNDLYKGLLLVGTIQAEILSRDNSIAITTLPRYVITSFFTSPTSKNISANASIEKNIHLLKLKTSFGGNMSYLESTSKINQAFVVSKYSIHSFQFNIVSKWHKKYNFEISSSLLTTSIFNRSTSLKTYVSSAKYGLKSIFYLNNKLDGSFLFASLQNKGQQTFYSCDGIWQYKINKFIGLNITLHNIFDQKYFFEKQYDIYSYAESNINLLGRIILIGIQCNF